MKLLMLMAVSLFVISCASDTQKDTVKENNEVKVINYKMYPKWSANSTIYEVNIRQYTAEGTFGAFIEHIDRLSEMGVDILWFMPITPIGEKNRKDGLGSYYSVKDYVSINPEFGTAEDFKAVVDYAHEKGMHVIIDWVANHTAWDHKWVAEHPQWYKMDENGVLKSPFDWTDVVALNYDNKDLRVEMTKQMEYWVDNFNIDGFRCDVASMVPTDFWDSTRAVLNTKKEIFMVAEAEEPELNKNAFEGSYAWAMHHKMSSVAKGESKPQELVNQINDDITKFGKDAYLMQFTTNHDENSWNGTEFEKMGDAYQIMAALTYVAPGIPLIYSGQESKNIKRLLFFEKDQIEWKDYEFMNFYRSMTMLKKEYKALWNGPYGGDFNNVENDNENQIVSFSRTLGSNVVLFVGNFSKSNAKVSVSLNEIEGVYTNYISSEALKLKRDSKFELKAWEYIILIK